MRTNFVCILLFFILSCSWLLHSQSDEKQRGHHKGPQSINTMTSRIILLLGAFMCSVMLFAEVARHKANPSQERNPGEKFPDLSLAGPLRRNLRGLCISFGCSTTYGAFGMPSGSISTSNSVTPGERAPDQAKQEMKRALLRLKMNARRFKRKAKGQEYTYEYAMEEYNQVGEYQDQFVDSDYTKVSVSTNGVVSPTGHPSTLYLFNKITRMLRRAMKEPTKLGNYKFVYSRRNGLPRYVMLEHSGKSLRISARKLNILGGDTSPTQRHR